MNNRRPGISRLAIIGFILAFIVPVLGCVVSIIAWQRINKTRSKGKILAILGSVIGGILSIPFIFIFWLFIALGGFKSNGAVEISKPFTSKLEQIGAHKICDNGDSGYGIDNSTPWYHVYYEISDNPDLKNQIKEIGRQQGFMLEDKYPNLKASGQNPVQISGIGQDSYGEEEYQYMVEQNGGRKFDYLSGQDAGNELEVIINRNASLSLACSKDYGRVYTIKDQNVVIDINFSLPPVN